MPGGEQAAAGRCTAKVLPLLIYVDSFLDPWCTRDTTFSSSSSSSPVHPLAHACAHRGQCKQCVKLLFQPLLRTSTLPFRDGESFQANYPRVQHRAAFREGMRAPIIVIFLLAATRNKSASRVVVAEQAASSR